MKNTTFKLLFVALCWLLCLACRPLFPLSAGRVSLISDKMPPTFEFKGRLNLEYVQFVGPYSVERHRFLTADGDGSDNTVAWRIDPPNFHYIPVNDCPPITYGQLPPAWEQEIPKTGTPLQLVEGAVYYVGAELNEGRRIIMCVLIRDGKPQVYHGKLDRLDCDKE